MIVKDTLYQSHSSWSDYTLSRIGFQDLLLANKVAASRSEIPSRNTLSAIHLNRIFDIYLTKMKDLLKAAPQHFSMTCDIWSDKYRHGSFICFTVHFVDSMFRLVKYSLKTEPFDVSHTGEAIAQQISNVATEYNFKVNKLIIVSPIRMESSRDPHLFEYLTLCFLRTVKPPQVDSRSHSWALVCRIINVWSNSLSSNYDQIQVPSLW